MVVVPKKFKARAIHPRQNANCCDGCAHEFWRVPAKVHCLLYIIKLRSFHQELERRHVELSECHSSNVLLEQKRGPEELIAA